MAAVDALRDFLQGPIGLGTNALGLDRANAIIDEGLGSIEDFVDLSSDNAIKTLCQNV